MRFPLAIVSLLGLIAAAPAEAKLVTFNVDGSVLDCDYGGGCDAFAEQTGLPPPTGGNFADFGVTFTLDTAAPFVGDVGESSGVYVGDDFQGSVYLVDSPGAGLSISIGALTLFSSRFFVALGSHEESDGLYTNAFRLSAVYPDQPEYWFEFGSISDSPFPSFSLNELVRAPLSEFDRMPLNPSLCAVRISVPQSWTVCGARSMKIEAQTVPEPGTTALFCLGLAGVGLMRRRRSATRTSTTQL